MIKQTLIKLRQAGIKLHMKLNLHFFINRILVISDYHMHLKCVKCLLERRIKQGRNAKHLRSSPGKLLFCISALHVDEAAWFR